jgi:hypothetical protein
MIERFRHRSNYATQTSYPFGIRGALDANPALASDGTLLTELFAPYHSIGLDSLQFLPAQDRRTFNGRIRFNVSL